MYNFTGAIGFLSPGIHSSVRANPCSTVTRIALPCRFIKQVLSTFVEQGGPPSVVEIQEQDTDVVSS